MPERYRFSEDQYLFIGKVAKAHGLKGDLKCIPLTDLNITTLTKSRFALIADDGRMTNLLKAQKLRVQGKWFILKLETIDTRNEAELTADMGVLLWREDLPDPEEGAFLPHQLRGLEVRVHPTDESIGVVESTFNNGAQEILVVRGTDGEFLIPFVDDFILSCSDTEIIVDPPPGLLEINS